MFFLRCTSSDLNIRLCEWWWHVHYVRFWALPPWVCFCCSTESGGTQLLLICPSWYFWWLTQSESLDCTTFLYEVRFTQSAVFRKPVRLFPYNSCLCKTGLRVNYSTDCRCSQLSPCLPAFFLLESQKKTMRSCESHVWVVLFIFYTIRMCDQFEMLHHWLVSTATPLCLGADIWCANTDSCGKIH